RQAGQDYDPDGMLAATGIANQTLLDKLNLLPYYQQSYPKSLGKEWVVQHVFPLVNASFLSTNDQLATFCEHVALQVSAATNSTRHAKLLITGGGAFNRFLISRIRHHASPEIIIPDENTVNYKEALIFAFLGVLRWRQEINCLRSVTGARRDSSGGAIY
ncbi:MAG: anhydro-N-acetylmuramic acid kinase, partial [Bacteroidetes bacterium]|nr:anhydro-N-acetylmuramic acid kinase [Bacteroidota bacterium]